MQPTHDRPRSEVVEMMASMVMSSKLDKHSNSQNTVVALHAPSLYSQSVARLGQNLNLTGRINELTVSLEETVRGSGCALVQTVLRYNSPWYQNRLTGIVVLSKSEKNRIDLCNN